MTIETTHSGRVTILSLSGNITRGAVGAKGITAAVLRALDAGERWFLFDLARVGYVDSAGLGDLVQAHAAIAKHGGAVKLLDVGKRLHDLLMLTRLLTEFDCVDNEAEALASLNLFAIDARRAGPRD